MALGVVKEDPAEPRSRSVIEVRALTKRFGGLIAVNAISIT